MYGFFMSTPMPWHWVAADPALFEVVDPESVPDPHGGTPDPEAPPEPTDPQNEDGVPNDEVPLEAEGD